MSDIDIQLADEVSKYYDDPTWFCHDGIPMG